MKDCINDEIKRQTYNTISSIKQHFKSGDDISVSLIQRKCRVGYNSAYRALFELISDGFIEKQKDQNSISRFK